MSLRQLPDELVRIGWGTEPNPKATAPCLTTLMTRLAVLSLFALVATGLAAPSAEQQTALNSVHVTSDRWNWEDCGADDSDYLSLGTCVLTEGERFAL
jgi:hypothetical protein